MSRAPSRHDGEWQWARPDAHGPAFRWTKRGDEVIVEWLGLGTLHASLAGEYFVPCAGVPEDRVEKLRHGVVLAASRSLRGMLSLHAGAATRGDKAIVILGDSGAGKSTTVGELCAHHGFEILSDDILAVDRAGDAYCALPTEGHHWLTPHARDLLGLAPDADVVGTGVLGTASEIAAIVHLRLAPGTRHLATRVRGRAALTRILANAVRLPFCPDAALREQFDAAVDLCDHVPVWECMRAAEDSPGPRVARLLTEIDFR